MTDQRDDIDTLLAVGDTYLADAGFTEGVVERLPRRAGRRAGLRLAVLTVSTLLAAVVGVVVLPLGDVLDGLATWSSGGWTTPGFIAGVVALAVVIGTAAVAAFSES